jgi:hypothetical protein
MIKILARNNSNNSLIQQKERFDEDHGQSATYWVFPFHVDRRVKYADQRAQFINIDFLMQ